MRISFEDAVEQLKSGEVVAIPTETVYGLAASYQHENAIKQIFSLKKRPPSNPLILHISSEEELDFFTKEMPSSALKLAKTFWPGPLTLVLPARKERLSPLIRAGLSTVAIRMPSHPLTQKLLKETGPLVAPSANLSGRPSATQGAHIEEDFGESFPFLDGAPSSSGVESTILIWGADGRWHLGRAGAIPEEELEHALGEPLTESLGSISEKRPLCPGQLLRHYAPKAQLVLAKQIPEDAKVILGLSGRTYPPRSRLLLLGSNAEEVAHNLYETLRALDRAGIEKAHIDVDLPSGGLWSTILERISKAANNQ